MSVVIRRRRAGLALLLLLTAGLARPHGQQPTQTPRFTGGVDVAVVDFLALSADGRSIADLRAEEVTVKIDGRARAVRSLQLVQLAPAPAAAAAGMGVPPPYGSNAAPEEGRAILIAIDDESFRPGRERPLRVAVAQFLTELSPRDRVALATMPHGGVRLDFTTRHDRVVEALTKVDGRAPQTVTPADAACRSRFTLDALRDLLDTIHGGEGPTTILFFSSGMIGPRRGDPLPLRGPASAAMIAPTSNTCEITAQHFQSVGAAAASARAQLYVIQPDEGLAGGGVQMIGGSDSLLAGLEHLAGVTGGRQLTLAVTSENALGRVIRETGAYYLVGFELQPSDRGDQGHELDLKVARSGVSVRARPRLVVEKKDAPPTAAAAAPSTPRAMIRSATAIRGVSLRAASFASRGSAGQVKIVSVTESSDPSVPLTAAAAGLFDETGRLVAQWTAAPSDLASPPLMSVLIAPAGRYRMRVAVTDGAGRAGTADSAVDAELTAAGSLTLSSLLLGVWKNNGFMPQLQFSAEPVALSYFEIYGGAAGARIGAMLELAATANGPALLRMPLAIEATGEADRFSATGALPIASLQPGDYVVRAIVGLEGQPEGRVIRTLRKIAR